MAIVYIILLSNFGGLIKKTFTLARPNNCFVDFQSEHFPFLGTHTTRAYKDMRSRTTFYIALGRLLMVDLGEDDEKFESFMTPITSKCCFGCYSERVRDDGYIEQTVWFKNTHLTITEELRKATNFL